MWCYSQPAELRFGSRPILASTGVQQLGPLLFSLVLLQFIDFIKLHDLVKLHLWYLDDGTFIGSKSSLLKLILFQSMVPNLVLSKSVIKM